MSEHTSVLSDAMMQRFAERRASYDRENRFFQEDFDELKSAGYLTLPIPKELGGGGIDLATMCREQRRLAYYAPATALGVNMHVYWMGLIADLWRQGDRSLEWALREGAAGEVFNAGHAERSNDLPVLLSTSTAERVDGGFRFSGHKMFCSLAPVFTRYGMHGMWMDPDGTPKVVHAFMPRNTAGSRIKETWDTMGMRATRSDDMILENVFVPDSHIARIVPAGGVDAFVLGIFAWALLGFGAVYHGMAQRALELAVATVQNKSSLGLSRSMAHHPGLQHAAAEAALALAPVGPLLEQTAADWSNGVDHGATWPARIVSAKYHAVEACWKIVDHAMEMSGGAGMFRSNEMEQLFRDARCGRFHPANTYLVHEIVAKTTLGVGLDEQPRWG